MAITQNYSSPGGPNHNKTTARDGARPEQSRGGQRGLRLVRESCDWVGGRRSRANLSDRAPSGRCQASPGKSGARRRASATAGATGRACCRRRTADRSENLAVAGSREVRPATEAAAAGQLLQGAPGEDGKRQATALVPRAALSGGCAERPFGGRGHLAAHRPHRPTGQGPHERCLHRRARQHSGRRAVLAERRGAQADPPSLDACRRAHRRPSDRLHPAPHLVPRFGGARRTAPRAALPTHVRPRGGGAGRGVESGLSSATAHAESQAVGEPRARPAPRAARYADETAHGQPIVGQWLRRIASDSPLACLLFRR